jgi:leucyl/phenylalanyl-tRNA--protein transferase
MPIEPPPTIWNIPSPNGADNADAIAIGADLEPGTILASYRSGVFPMPSDEELVWWSPVNRAIIPLDNLKVTRSLRQSEKRYRTTINQSFSEVIRTCADPMRPGFWISPEIIDAYETLHRLGWAHSVETWDGEQLVGGLYGIAIGGFFAGESMFYKARDASKVALNRLVTELRNARASLLDVQWLTPHLARLGAVNITREEYLAQLAHAISLPQPKIFDEISGVNGD